MTEKQRNSSSQEQRRRALETTNEVARQKQEAEKRMRDEKTSKLRAARFAVQQAAESNAQRPGHNGKQA